MGLYNVLNLLFDVQVRFTPIAPKFCSGATPCAHVLNLVSRANWEWKMPDAAVG